MFSTIADGSYQIFPCHETLVEIKSEKENKRNTSANQIDKDKALMALMALMLWKELKYFNAGP